MVLEQFLESDHIKKHIFFVFGLGIAYVIIGYIVSAYFFKDSVSVAMLFTTTLLLVPSIYTILGIEEGIESRDGVRHFFHDHKDIFEIYISLFIGIFFAFLFLGTVSQASVFSYQTDFLQKRGDISSDIITKFKQSDYAPSLIDLEALVSNNLLVVIICFILSVFYGAGALFLIVLNASIFASFVNEISKAVGNMHSILSLFLIHLIPELSGFLIAAIAGGVVSRAIVNEKFGSDSFKNVMTDALILLLISAGLIIIGAALELYVTAPIVKTLI
jgi:hypothetical protein